MNFYFIGACEALAAFGAASVTASAVLLALWPLLKRRLARLPASPRARALLALRLAPTALGLLVMAGLVIPSYLTLEPRDTAEVPGEALAAAALAGLVLAVRALARLASALRKTARVVRGWTAAATPVTLAGADCRTYRVQTPVPLVALAGLRRPRLFLSGSVLDGCGPHLVSAIVAHEMGHRRSADNLKRLLLEASADPITLFRAGREMTLAWDLASEDAADDEAITAGACPEDLAEALLRVARLAPPEGFPAAPVAAFYRGEAFEGRVRRLMASSPSGTRRGLRRRSGAALLLLLALAWILAAHSLLRPVHRLFEHAVHGPHADQRSLVVVHPSA